MMQSASVAGIHPQATAQVKAESEPVSTLSSLKVVGLGGAKLLGVNPPAMELPKPYWVDFQMSMENGLRNVCVTVYTTDFQKCDERCYRNTLVVHGAGKHLIP